MNDWRDNLRAVKDCVSRIWLEGDLAELGNGKLSRCLGGCETWMHVYHVRGPVYLQGLISRSRTIISIQVTALCKLKTTSNSTQGALSCYPPAFPHYEAFPDCCSILPTFCTWSDDASLSTTAVLFKPP